MRNPGGYMTTVSPEGVEEQDTFTCFHCNRIVIVPVRAKPEDIGGMCSICAKLICPTCVGKSCTPLEERLQRMEARRSYDECSG